MSFLIDGPWLYATGNAYARLTRGSDSEPPAAVPAPPGGDRRALKRGAATIACFWGLSIPLYLNHRWTAPVWRACGAKSGRDWMVNSGVLRFDADRVSPRGHRVASVLFATYPLWLWLGYRNGLKKRGDRRAGQAE